MKRLDLCVFDLSLAEARAQLSKDIGEPAAQDIVRQAGERALFVVYGRDGNFSLAWTPTESVVLEALEAGLAEVGTSPPGCGMRFAWHVGPNLEAKLRASVSDYERRHTRGAPSRAIQ